MLEASLNIPDADEPEYERRHRLLELYLGDAKTPEKAIYHVEVLLIDEPGDEKALEAGDKLLRVKDVASRAAAALQEARRVRRGQY